MAVVVKRYDSRSGRHIYDVYNYMSEDGLRELAATRITVPTGDQNEHVYQIAVVDMDKAFEEAWQKQSLSAVENRE